MKEILEEIYATYTRPRYISPDPLQFLVPGGTAPGPDAGAPVGPDREIVGLIASALALGRVGCIIPAVSAVLDRLPNPREFLLFTSETELRKRFEGFVYRFFRAEHLAAFLGGIGRVLAWYGSLENCYAAGCRNTADGAGPDSLGGISFFARELCRASEGRAGMLVSDPGKKSACKRLFLYLRWMIRRDAVDPGVWNQDSSRLIVPVDTHMLKFGRILGLTERNQPDLKTALEITEGFRRISPEDPVRYDFSLTRLGIYPHDKVRAGCFERRLREATTP
jgi:uncharacterized protein (TIGR02757 family)